MRVHRFYVAPKECELTESIWIRSVELRSQWLKVFRYRAGDEVVLFDGISTERLYKIVEIADDAVHVELVTEFDRKLPKRHVYLFWSLLKKDKNEWVVQKCTELGVTNFVPVVAERSEKTGFNSERAEKIAIEAAEQCGRSDIPHMREPIGLKEALDEYKDKVNLLVAEEAYESLEVSAEKAADEKPVGVFVGPEGGWTENELTLFKEAALDGLELGHLILRAETAAVAAVTKLII